MTFRKLLFWLHLIAGAVGGLVVLVMSVTGVLLTYERQILAHFDRGQYQTPVPADGSARLSADEIVARIRVPRNSSLIFRAAPGEPVEVSAGRGEGFYVNPWDGRVLGAGDPDMHERFQKLRVWHRWLGTEGEGRATGKAITGACNFLFLFLVASGMYLWLPKIWSSRHLRPIVWFKGGLSAKARDFNWHNVFGIWMALPLLIIVATGLPMSYVWANNLLYTLTGSELPPQAGRGPGGRGGGRDGAREVGKASPTAVRSSSLAPLLARVQSDSPGWQSIAVRIPERSAADVVFTVDLGDGGQPQKRKTLTLDAASGSVKKTETFGDGSPGRRLRSWSRFAHTGEYYGIAGQTVAGLASFAGVMLVWTGLALALRRFFAWRARLTR